MHEVHTTTVSDGLATVERSIAVKDSGVLVTLAVTTDAPGETAVIVTDTAPSAVAATESGFHPNFSPDEGSVNDNRVVFAENITAVDPLQIIYGMVVDVNSVSIAWDNYSLRLDAVAPEPSAVAPNGETRSYADGQFAAGEEKENETIIPSEDTDQVRQMRENIDPALDSDAAASVSAGQLFATMETEDMVPPEPDEPQEPADPPLIDDDDGADAADSNAPDEAELEAAITKADEPVEPTIDDADEDVIPPHDRPDEESPDESAEADETAPKTGFEASSMSVGDALAAEIRDGGLDDETRETLSTAFGPGLSPDQQAQLDRIQSQIEDLSETVAPFDETEPAAALDALRADVDDLRADIEELS